MEEAGTDSQGCLPRNCSALGGKPLKREHSFLVLQVLAMQVIKEGVYASHGRGGGHSLHGLAPPGLKWPC